MGNVNGREDGSGSPSGVAVEVEEGSDSGGGGGGQEDMAEQDGAHVSYHAHGGPPELMGQSPPHSPRAAHSPLMFTPQASTCCLMEVLKELMGVSEVMRYKNSSSATLYEIEGKVPVVPLQRPDEMHIPSHSWMQTTCGYEDMCDEQGIPTMITWSYGGKEVAVEGSWDNWKTRKPLQRSGKDFTIMKVLPSGVYQYRFIIDGQWRYAPDIPWAQDDVGNAYNILDLQEYVPEDLESISGFEPPQSPESSYNNTQLGSEDYAKEPPLVPPHLQMTLLNVPASYLEIPPPLSRPQHVLLNHLYMQKGKSGPSVVALGSTHRFHAKYVTVVLYKSLQR